MGAQPSINIPKISEEEYLRIDEESLIKHEYYDGYILDMAGGSPAHSEIPSNLGFLIQSYLRANGLGCRTFTSDLRVWIEEANSYYYPDLTVVCHPPEYRMTSPQSLLNPTIVVEVLSPSTRKLDTSDKKMNYKLIASLQEIIFIDSTRPFINGLYRIDDLWVDSAEAKKSEDIYRINSFGLDMKLSDVYGAVLKDFGDIGNSITREG